MTSVPFIITCLFCLWVGIDLLAGVTIDPANDRKADDIFRDPD